ncbi:MAG TPA: hypothetical protein ACHBZ9_13260, partial [Arsenophonus nasoniae]
AQLSDNFCCVKLSLQRPYGRAALTALAKNRQRFKDVPPCGRAECIHAHHSIDFSSLVRLSC